MSVAAGFPVRWETVFETVTSALTLAMVFVIQHTQARHQRATQRKLDEILLAIPGTDNSLLTLEHASDDELHAVGIAACLPQCGLKMRLSGNPASDAGDRDAGQLGPRDRARTSAFHPDPDNSKKREAPYSSKRRTAAASGASAARRARMNVPSVSL